jgi:hypothetical protein
MEFDLLTSYIRTGHASPVEHLNKSMKAFEKY